MSPHGGGYRSRSNGIWLFSFTAENILYPSAIILGFFKMLRGSRHRWSQPPPFDHDDDPDRLRRHNYDDCF